ncbi:MULTISPECIES: YopT-type cysteine protease domain-containing protein [Buttiauxella]|uniref:YopT-type cysteine protease domain-containing protein n=1 Tax=Buttiauxella TaxID=82976 RepID=UPI001E4C7DCA|nr:MULTISPECIES: YopT-type cysteine protease domain-containing protein [Buttiauxella]MCE0827810.1 YopT-type cysteine protease domain-containing protein [Buttiauxella ferragutiae]
MRSASIQLISRTGGKYNHYSQNDYIVKNKWGHADPSKRQGAWIGNNHDSKGYVTEYGVEGGVCLGLAGTYLMAGKNWETFKPYIAAERGKGLVRGIVNYQEQLSKIGNMAAMKTVLHTILKNNNVNFINENRVSPTNTAEEISTGILNNIEQGFGYHLSIKRAGGGHSLAIRQEQGKIKLFDPNYGEVTYPYEQGRCEGMATFLTHLFSQYYNKYFLISIERYALN